MHISRRSCDIGRTSPACGYVRIAIRSSILRVDRIAPAPYQLQARLEKAPELMLHSNERLSAIALSVGYVDQNHFTRNFKHQTGATPNAWRTEE